MEPPYSRRPSARGKARRDPGVPPRGGPWLGMDRDDRDIRDGGGASPLTSPVCLGMWPPRRCGQELDLLGLDQRTELGGKPVDKICIPKERRPARPGAGIFVD